MLNRYEYDQNNSGGSFAKVKWTGPDEQGGTYQGSYPTTYDTDVYVMAHDLEEANYLAQRYGGVYFNGCRTGLDCNCCGDRWYGGQLLEE